jgi:signal transduction histidine kinase
MLRPRRNHPPDNQAVSSVHTAVGSIFFLKGVNTLAKSQILIVEDEAVVGMSLQDHLRRLGYDVPAVVDRGEAALVAVQELRPDLTLMDIHLKGRLDGIQAAEQIRSRFDIPVVFLTAYADDDTLERAKVTEPYGYLLKPFNEQELHTVIQVALYKHASEKRLRQIQGQLAQAERMAALGRLIAAIAHEINNPLQAIQGCLTLMQESLVREADGDALRAPGSGRELDALLGVAMQETTRIATIVRNVRDFCGPIQSERIDLDLQRVLQEVLEACHEQLSAGRVVVEPHWSPGLPRVHADPHQLQQAFRNLILNAVEAMPVGGTLRLSTSAETMRPATTADAPGPGGGAPPVAAVQVSFTDTGEGMSAETQSRLFEPFFTTKHQHLGLGLSVSHGIVQAHAGQIHVQSRPGVGTTFSVLLPVAGERTPASDGLRDA